MIQYKISYTSPASRMVSFEMKIPAQGKKSIDLQLSAWRPGRYELGNFAKNIFKFKAYDLRGHELLVHKKTKDLWSIECPSNEAINVKYDFYCNQLDAGSCFLDENQLYLNPVHCIFYIPGHELNIAYSLDFQVPNDYQLATSLEKESTSQLKAINYDQLADSPIIASNKLQKQEFTVEGVKFFCWWMGEVRPDFDKIKKDFTAFTSAQIKAMGGFPVKEYHYLIQILPTAFHHGVEHTANTVLAFGPGNRIAEPDMYMDFLSLSSHELYHSWNVKTLRPAEMYPYDYSKENYSVLGYVAEGVTTYMGDLYLAKSGVFSTKDYFKEIETHLKNHFRNYGRFNMSVAEASFDAWLDGYQQGAPHRKVSIYTEGALCGLMLDLTILHASNLKYALQDVMKTLYDQSVTKKKGYTEQEYIATAEKFAGIKLDWFMEKYLHGTQDYKTYLDQCLAFAGIELTEQKSTALNELDWGFAVLPNNEVASVVPNSPAEKAGLSRGDQLIAINNWKIDGDLNQAIKYVGSSQAKLQFFSNKQLRECTIAANGNSYFSTYKLNKMKNADQGQKDFFKAWTNMDFDKAE